MSKKQTFKAPDGKEFETKTEYRDYLMENYYSFKNRHNDILMKQSGEIDGQVFDIADCTNTSIAIMDYTDQVQIDNLKNCKVLIGACSGPIFIRNCENCTFFTCSRQLRLREVFNCTLFTFCASEIHIEESENLNFGPFLSGYKQQESHFQKAGLDPVKVNLWYDIYDHSVEDGVVHFKLLSVHESLNKVWYPQGDEHELTQFITLSTPPKTNASTVKTTTQVGEAFGMEQMRADAAAANKTTSKPVSKITSASAAKPKTEIILETALLIATANAHGTDLKLWFEDQNYHGLLDRELFDAKLKSLAATMSINQDASTKKELDIAASQSALRVVHNLCSVLTEDGRECVDVNKFIKLATLVSGVAVYVLSLI
jgi:hypothetical protein